MKKIVMIGELDYKELTSALRNLRRIVDCLSAPYTKAELDVELKRIEKIFDMAVEPMICSCYHDDQNCLQKRGVCWGTKEREPCTCGGDPTRCDFHK